MNRFYSNSNQKPARAAVLAENLSTASFSASSEDFAPAAQATQSTSQQFNEQYSRICSKRISYYENINSSIRNENNILRIIAASLLAIIIYEKVK